ncbi:hypothetical protein LZZ85_14525 [Terrimonas sp. NA20]|uniref:DUF4350 domain-containing protein n=1 Tax=Terrimonas ginsenosidimutans TaxID=2908004 RepID=A0ABS9KT94_9BACT|nr:hypothetical protein [Terrimonas ginsenosidimutans]MCG2615512.1 hypothetical protein [Terrimonas ginsenosidimutans]
MLKKHLILTLATLLFLTAFFLLPHNRTWAEKLLGYGRDLPGQIKAMSKESRLSKRFGNDYTYSKSIAENMRKNGQQHALLLMPPSSYFTNAGMKYHVPEPAVFYYFTGIKTVWAVSKEAINAELYIHVRDGQLLIARGNNKAALQDSITVFKKLGYTL